MKCEVVMALLPGDRVSCPYEVGLSVEGRGEVDGMAFFEGIVSGLDEARGIAQITLDDGFLTSMPVRCGAISYALLSKLLRASSASATTELTHHRC